MSSKHTMHIVWGIQLWSTITLCLRNTLYILSKQNHCGLQQCIASSRNAVSACLNDTNVGYHSAISCLYHVYSIQLWFTTMFSAFVVHYVSCLNNTRKLYYNVTRCVLGTLSLTMELWPTTVHWVFEERYLSCLI